MPFVGFDLRGHGKSAARSGISIHRLPSCQDIDEFLGFLRETYPKDTPFFIMGHSLGGLSLNADICVERSILDVKGIVVTAAGIALGAAGTKSQAHDGETAGDDLPPTLTIPSDLDVNMISHDREGGDAYVHDPLVHNKSDHGVWEIRCWSAIDFVFAKRLQFLPPLLVNVWRR